MRKLSHFHLKPFDCFCCSAWKILSFASCNAVILYAGLCPVQRSHLFKRETSSAGLKNPDAKSFFRVPTRSLHLVNFLIPA